jgi:Malectin domain
MKKKACVRMKFRYHIALLLMLVGGIPASAQVVITPSTPPVVNQGTASKFTANTAVTWSCPGCSGTVDADGTYHAPQTVKVQQSYGGYQLLPNNHILNTRIDSQPLNSNSALWIAGAGTVSVNYLLSFPINYVNGSTATATESFEYTPGNNGTFQIPSYPGLRVECGTLVLLSVGCDRHIFTIDTTNGTFQEIYDLVPPGTIPNCPSAGLSSCTAGSGVRYSNSTYNLPNLQGGGVDAAGMYVMPLTLRLQELEQAVVTGGTIKHALRFTLANGYIQNSFVWPGTANSTSGSGNIPEGARFRLKSDFNISSFSPIAQILLTQLKQYGIILADGGYGWQITTEYTRWPTAYRTAFNEIAAANIGPSNFEAVNESGLEVSPSSGLTTTAETVVATSVANPSLSAGQQVVLTGVTITLPKDEVFIQAGTSSQQLAAFINGSTDKSVIWSMNPAIGTLSSSGLYTPPATIGPATTATVTATSTADSSVAASQTLTVLPAGTIRLVLGQPNPYTDTNGNVWQPEVGDDGCHPYDNGGTWPTKADIILYKIACFGFNDIRFDITVPNGSYQITAKFAETEAVSAGYRLMDLEAQGQVVYPNVDIVTSAGGVNKPVDFTLPATVTNGILSFVVRHVAGDFTLISALQIVPGSGSTSTPAPPTGLTVIHVQ